MANDDSHWAREQRLDRAFSQEPTLGRDRQRIPLNERGTLKQQFSPTCKSCGERVASRDDLSDSEQCGKCFVHTMAACSHELVEALSLNGRNLDGAVRRCAACGVELSARKAG